ncbi:hypothetical protein AB3X94_07120 [Paraburkholderia sp. BR10923]|uniref:hypothetical protein n=1 Tax=Paraburkholderia sp. BR10923 TaxID=3236992 RepID=UPI0034CE49F8
MKWMIGRADDLTGDRWLSGPASWKTCRPFLFCRYRMPKGEALLVNPFGFYTASSGSTEGGAHDEQVIEQWFGPEDEHGNPAKGYKYDLLKDGVMHTRAASFDSGQSTAVEGAADLCTVMWLDREPAART